MLTESGMQLNDSAVFSGAATLIFNLRQIKLLDLCFDNRFRCCHRIVMTAVDSRQPAMGQRAGRSSPTRSKKAAGRKNFNSNLIKI
ncbi:hypothetical protein EVAR_51311_1 [Eumeta japonica]|uniref:Uncharacterized protein n=1 Tax=Eumeta variegata TaxID=151549 RepID=A0A4C1XT28_EUMVA|nr:hypothetical protein EVAR_51311_1 [Eumeta japonica]